MIHFVYPFGDKIAAPWSIGNHVSAYLRAHGHPVTQYDWQDVGQIEMTPGKDILLGHPHPSPGKIFTDNLDQPWRIIAAICPWNGTGLKWMIPILDRCKHYFAICGPYWASKKPNTVWWNSCTALDMAIDCHDYPQIKHGFNPPGQRKILYIGCTVREKGCDFLTEIIHRMPWVRFSHMGRGLIAGSWPYGYVDMASPNVQRQIAEHDFVIAPGRHDANPTTILEAMAWGLIPICTPEAGWSVPPAIHIPLDNSEGANTILYEWLHRPDAELLEIQQRNLKLAREFYTWDNFCSKIMGVLNVQ